jgi:hypothetical protein
LFVSLRFNENTFARAFLGGFNDIFQPIISERS